MINPISFNSFSDELTKIADGLGGHAAEIAGLGILAVPHLKNLATGKKVSSKTERNAELTGLGILAAPSIHAIGRQLLKKAGADLWNPSSGMLNGRAGGTAGGLVTGAASAPKPKFTLDHLKAGYAKAGIKPGLGSAAREVKPMAKVVGALSHLK